MNPRLIAAGLVLGLATASAAPRRDLDVGVPPGSPLDWGRAFPAVTPRDRPLFPESRAAEDSKERSSASAIPTGLSVRTSSSFALVRILTWDLGAHIEWIGSTKGEPVTGRTSLRPAPPVFGSPLYWVSLAPLLRLLLHPGEVSRAATIAHLVEIGDASLTAVDEAASESSLRRAASEVRARVALPESARREATEAALEPRARMLTRFAREELLRQEPYDPEQAFGARLFLFAEELFPILLGFVSDSASPELRRNATSAIARYRTAEAMQALFELACTTDDDVVLMRALSGLGRQHVLLEWERLIARMEASDDEVEIVAITAALGRSGSVRATEAVLAVARSAFARRDADLLEASLAALTGLPAGEHAAELEDLLRGVERTARLTPRLFQPAGPKPRIEPDQPDGPRARGRVIAKLAVIARARLAPGDTERLEALLALVEPNAASTADSVPPAARLLFVEALGAARTPETSRSLSAFARFASIPVAAHALNQLPLDERSTIALELFESTDPERRLMALEALLDSFHKRSESLSKSLLRECAEAEAGFGGVAERALWLAAVRALDLRGRLTARSLAPLVPHVQSARDSFAGLPGELAERVDELIERAAAGAQKVELRELVRSAVDFVVRHSMNAAIDRESASEARQYASGLLESVRAHRSDPAYLKAVRERVLGHLLGYPVPTLDPNFAQFAPPVLLAQEILLALGRTGTPQAAELILRVLDNKRNNHRAVACLALGMSGQASAADRLAPFLLDSDPFARFCAFEALRHLVEYDEVFDWMYAPAEERFAAAEATWKWLVERRR